MRHCYNGSRERSVCSCTSRARGRQGAREVIPSHCRKSLHHPSSGGSLLIGCKGERNFQALGYSYSTTYHLNAVRVPKELSADKNGSASLRVTLRKQGSVIDVVEVQ
jgi:hypothetical protein